MGSEFDGLIAAVTGFGLFVELGDLYIEGLVHISTLPQDYYQFDQAHQRLVGERSRRVYQLGDSLRVQVLSVNLDDRKIDLGLASGSDKRRKPGSVREALARGELPGMKNADSSKKGGRKTGGTGKKDGKSSRSASANKKRRRR